MLSCFNYAAELRVNTASELVDFIIHLEHDVNVKEGAPSHHRSSFTVGIEGDSRSSTPAAVDASGDKSWR